MRFWISAVGAPSPASVTAGILPSRDTCTSLYIVAAGTPLLHNLRESVGQACDLKMYPPPLLVKQCFMQGPGFNENTR